MKRRLIAAALILVFPFGTAACGAQSKEAACKHIQKAAVSANKSAKIKGTSPDDIRDSLDQIIKTYKKANKKITNKKVKAAFTPLIEDLEKLRDATKSPGASTGGPDLMTDMSNHGKALNDLCGFDWGTGQCPVTNHACDTGWGGLHGHPTHLFPGVNACLSKQRDAEHRGRPPFTQGVLPNFNHPARLLAYPSMLSKENP